MFMFPNEEQRKNTYCVQFKNYFVNRNNISWLQNGTSICTVKSIKDILLHFIQFRNTFYTWVRRWRWVSNSLSPWQTLLHRRSVIAKFPYRVDCRTYRRHQKLRRQNSKWITTLKKLEEGRENRENPLYLRENPLYLPHIFFLPLHRACL
jgi:hypothetical protein